ncbi:hypothetical protein KEM54_000117 [Ascosphaera aggregata]|nr:hypothetical protein KEM54_000117 [Ascosphaera aggregata]
MEAQALSSDADYKDIARAVQPPQIPACRSHDSANNQKRTDPFQFGSRYLEEGDNVFEFNAWDHVETDDGYKEYAELQYARQRENPVSDFDRKRFNDDPAKWWNLFYKNNTANFFKNRKWLQQEFPVLAEVTQADAGPKVVLEIGAGAGNSAFPILAQNKNPQFKLHACDYSKKAVEVMRASEHYDEKFMTADVWDISAQGDDSLPPGLTEGSVDVAVMIFIFSALAPSEWAQALKNVYRVLKPGGVVLFRDYGRGDLAQVRFKKGRYLDDNFYVRGDGTRVYFFEKEQLEHIWGNFSPETENPLSATSAGRIGGCDEENDNEVATTVSNERTRNGFEVLDLGVDRRLLVNRQKKLKMYRCLILNRSEHRIKASTEMRSKEDWLGIT